MKHGDTLRELNKNESYFSKEILESLITYFENDITCMIQLKTDLDEILVNNCEN